MKNEECRINLDKFILLITLFAFAARAAGIGWGFPLTLNNDESALVRSALGMRFGDLNPHYFDWPSLYRYLNFFLFMFFIKLRVPFQVHFGVETMRRVLPFWWGPTLPFYFLARLLTVSLATVTIYLLYKISRRFLDQKTSLLAALFLAVNYGHIINSQIATLDVAMTFFFALSVYFALEIFQEGKLRDYLLAGLFLGLATSTKYNAGFGVFFLLVAHFLRILGNRRRKTQRVSSPTRRVEEFGGLLLAGLAAVGGFLLGTPFALLDWQKLIENDTRAQASEWIAENIPQKSILAGVGTIAGDYGGELPQIRRVSKDTPEEGYIYHGLGSLATVDFEPTLLGKTLKDLEIEYVILSSRVKNTEPFQDWVREQAVAIQTFEPVWNDVSPRIEICKVDYENL